MEVFISWSGERSGAAARALHDWLPMVVNALKPWLSSADIDKGARWGSELAMRLEASRAGILCITPNNVHSDWLLFEAGALSKAVSNTFVCPLLIGVEPSDIKGPLIQFQTTRASKEDMLKLVKTLNRALGELALTEQRLEAAFQMWWPELERKLSDLPLDGSAPKLHRDQKEVLEEILELVRNQGRRDQESRSLSPPPDYLWESEKTYQTRVLIAEIVLRELGPDARVGFYTSKSAASGGFDAIVTLRSSRKGYSITVNRNDSLEQIEAYVMEHIKKFKNELSNAFVIGGQSDRKAKQIENKRGSPNRKRR